MDEESDREEEKRWWRDDTPRFLGRRIKMDSDREMVLGGAGGVVGCGLKQTEAEAFFFLCFLCCCGWLKESWMHGLWRI